MTEFNGMQKPADVIAKGPHVYDEATRKYKEAPSIFSEYPRAMWNDDGGYIEARSLEHRKELEAKGWKIVQPPVKVAKENVQAPAADLALIVLQQQQEMKRLTELVESQKKTVETAMANIQPPQVIPDPQPRLGGRPKVYPLTMTHATEGKREVHSKAERDTLEAKGWVLEE